MPIKVIKLFRDGNYTKIQPSIITNHKGNIDIRSTPVGVEKTSKTPQIYKSCSTVYEMHEVYSKQEIQALFNKYDEMMNDSVNAVEKSLESIKKGVLISWLNDSKTSDELRNDHDFKEALKSCLDRISLSDTDVEQ